MPAHGALRHHRLHHRRLRPVQERGEGHKRVRVRRIFQLFYAKIMVVGDGQFYRGFGGYWDFGFWDVGKFVHVNLERIWH